jgi:hypothetical protein
VLLLLLLKPVFLVLSSAVSGNCGMTLVPFPLQFLQQHKKKIITELWRELIYSNKILEQCDINKKSRMQSVFGKISQNNHVQYIKILDSLGGVGVACWPLLPKFTRQN